MPTTTDSVTTGVRRVRRFNRLYTRRIGVLEEGHLHSPYSLAEVRVLYELAHADRPTAAGVARALDLDAGYLSRILQRLRKRGLVVAARSPGDRRRIDLRLSRRGRQVFAGLDRRADQEIRSLLEPLSPGERVRLTEALGAAERLLGGSPAAAAPACLIRTHQPGDLGWMVERHGAVYDQEYRWGEPFEALVAGIAAGFLERHDPTCERCWIAELDGARVGSVMLVKESETVARLRLLLVEPSARGRGIGERLVAECIRFARRAGYRRITLWTNHVLHAARRIYEKAGFRLVAEEPHDRFGKGLVGQTWDLDL